MTTPDPPARRRPVVTGLPDLVERARRLAAAAASGSDTRGRRLLGITGAPGAGKSTLADQLAQRLGPDTAVVVPMDGFHLANATLNAWHRHDRKGAWDTFDAEGYLVLLQRLRHAGEAVVHAPGFDRTVDASIGAAIPVSPDIPLVVTEGNYLLSRRGAWAQVAGLLDEVWFLDVADDLRLRRLTRRHERHGMSAADARAWARGSDQANAELVTADADRADLRILLCR